MLTPTYFAHFLGLKNMPLTVINALFSCFLFVVATLSNPASAQTKVADTTNQENARRLNTSLRLITHSQRIVKLYFETVLEVDVEHARPKINESISVISNSLDKLQKENLSAVAQTHLKEADTIWSSMLRQLSGTSSKAIAEGLQAPNEKLLDALEKLTTELAKVSKHSNSEIVLLVSKQAALSQRIARNYFAHQLGLSGNNAKARVVDLVQRFTAVEEELEAFAGSNPKLKGDLDLVKVQLMFFKNIVERMDSATKADISGMAKISGRLLEVLNRMEHEFAK
jgi:hypothetical protein